MFKKLTAKVALLSIVMQLFLPFNFTFQIGSNGFPSIALETNSTHAATIDGSIAPGGVSSDLALWLKADVGGASWTDQSETPVTVIAQGNPSLSTTSLNFNPQVSFDGDDTYLINDDFAVSGTDAFSVSFVMNPVTGGSRILGEAVTDTNAHGFFFLEGNRLALHQRNTGNIAESSTIIRDGTPHISGMRRAGNDFTTFVDGAIDGAVNSSANFAPLTNYELGNDSGGGGELIGDMAEVIIYKTDVSNTQQQQIDSYLGLKYGITLSGTGYLNSAGSQVYDLTDTYNNDVFGIAKDDASGLDQRVSQSVNSGSILTVSTDTDFTSANTTHGDTLVDGQYFVVGSDGGVLTTQTSELDTNTYLTRISREWRVENTNSVGTVNLSFDNFDDNYVLLTSTTGDFSTGATNEGSLSVSGAITLTLDDGEFFTLATLVVAPTEAPGGVSSDIALWLKADAGITGTSEVTQWDDQSNNNISFTDAGAGREPSVITNALNFNPTVTFDGTNDLMQYAGNPLSANDLNASNNAMFIVLNARDEDTVFNQEAGINGASPLITGGGRYVRTRNGGNNNTPTSNFNEPYVLGYVKTGLSNLTKYQNGLSQDSIALGTAISAGVLNNRTTLGGRNQSLTNNYVDGDIAELITYDTNISGTDQQQIESYLGLKYGISLDQTAATDYISSAGTGTLMWDSSLNTNYNNDIAGIGRDDGSALDQRISRSVNSDSTVSMALQNDFVSANIDVSRAEAHSDDLEFLTWANNDDTLAFKSNTGGGASADFILERNWQVQETGNVANGSGTIYIEFDISGINVPGGGIPTASDIFLILGNNDDDFATIGGQLSAISFSEGKAVFELTDGALTDGRYFTLGCNATENTHVAPGGIGSDIALWLKADNGGSSWQDQSGNSTILTAVGAPALNSSLLNFNPQVSFNGGSHYNLTNAGFVNGTGDKAIYVVASRNTNAGATYAATIGSGNPNRFASFGHWGTFPNDPFLSTSGFEVTSNDSSWSINTPAIVGYALDSGEDQLYTNSSLLGIAQDDVSLNITNGNLGRIGAFTSGGAQWSGDIAEVLVYNQDTNDNADRQQIESYLAVKYGITLDASVEDYLSSTGNSVYTLTGATSVYSNDIFGIAKDDASDLDQRISKSTNSGTILTLSTDTDFTSANTTHTGTLIDGQYLVLGNNGGAITTQTSELDTTTYATRTTREWRVENTDSVGTVNLSFDNFNDSYVLLTSTTGDFSTGATNEGSLSASGAIALTLDDGEFFTLATLVPAPTEAPGGVSSDLSLWLKADSDVIGGASVTGWNDQSGNAHNFVQDPAENAPDATSRLTNFNPTVTFDGTDGLHLLGSDLGLSGTTDLSYYYVATPDTLTGQQTIIEFFDLGVGSRQNKFTNGFLNVVRRGGSISGDITTATVTNQSITGIPSLGSYVRTTPTGILGNDSLYNSSNTDNQNINIDEITIGARPNGFGERLTGSIAEVITYTDANNNTERQQIESYLALKYGITLASGTLVPYTATDTFSVFTSGPVSRINDGNISTVGTDDFQYHPADATSTDLVTMTFTDPVDIGHGIFYNRTSCCQDRIAEAQMIFKDDTGATIHTYTFPGTYDNVNDSLNPAELGGLINISSPTGIIANVKTVELTNFQGAGQNFREIEFYSPVYLDSSGSTVFSYDGIYQNDVFGIAKDDASSLDQRISSSVNTGSILTVSTDTDFSSANTSHSDSLTDGQYLMIANNGGVTATQTSELATGFSTRVIREWRAQNTDSIGTVHLSFDGFDDSYVLLTSNTGDFSSGATNEGALSASGSIALTLDDGQYFTLAVVDNIPPIVPVITLPSNFNPVTGTGEPGAIVNIFSSTGALIGTGTVTGSGTFSITPSPIPSTGPITITTTDPAGNTSTGSVIGTGSIDTTAPAAPTVVTPTNFNPLTGTGEVDAVVSVFSSTGALIGTGVVDSSGNFSISVNPAPIVEPITVNQTDEAGNTSVNTTISTGGGGSGGGGIDTTPPAAPTVNTPTNFNPLTGTGEIGTTIKIFNTLNVVIGTGIVDSNGEFSITPNPIPTAGPINVTSTDDADNESTPTTIPTGDIDDTIPTIALVGSGTITLEIGDTYSELGATYNDNLDGTGSTAVSGDTVTTTGTGSFTINYNYTDIAGNDAVQVTRTVNVEDNTIPVISLNGSGAVSQEALQTYTDAGATYLDNLDGTGSLVGSGVVNTSIPNVYPIYFNFTDASGNNALEVIRNVTITTPTCNPGRELATATGGVVSCDVCEAGSFNATAGGTCTGAQTGYFVANTESTQELACPAGTFNSTTGNISCTTCPAGYDSGTGATSCADTEIPVITLSGSSLVTLEIGDIYTDAGASWSDNEIGSMTGTLIATGNTVITTGTGSFTLNYNYTDAAGNDAVQVTRTVHVEDNTIPTISLVGSGTITLEIGDTYSELGATFTDNLDGTGSTVVSGDTVTTTATGSFTINYNYTDVSRNDAAQVTRTVHVVDTTDPVVPVITLPTNFSSLTGTGEIGTTIKIFNTENIVIGTGIVDSSGNFSITPSPIPTSGPINVTSTDESGNESTVTTISTASIDLTVPEITLSGASIITHELNTSYIDFGATVTDNLDGDISSNIVVVNPVDISTPGSYTVTYNITDAAGNIALQVTRLVNVVSSITDTDEDGVPDVIEAEQGTDVTNSGSFLDTDNDSTPDFIDLDDDGDGSLDSVETAAPNGGDFNSDGLQDILQQNVATIVSPIIGEYVGLDTSSGSCASTSFNIVAESSLTNQNSPREFPFGLADFTLDCSSTGATANIKIYYDQEYDTSNWEYQKYNNTTDSYTDISSIVSYTTETIGTGVVTVVSYDITDGGVNDEDGIANGIIVDPSGPSVVLPTTNTLGSGGGNSPSACRDIEAINYSRFGKSDSSLCEYEDTVVAIISAKENEDVEDIVEETENNFQTIDKNESEKEITEPEENIEVIKEKIFPEETVDVLPINTVEKTTDDGVGYTLSRNYDSCSTIGLLTNPNFNYTTESYSDIEDSAYKDEILKFSEAGIVNGYDDGTFGALSNISRTEFLKVVLKTHCLEYDDQNTDNLAYIDVDKDHWQARVISKAEQIGIINGDILEINRELIDTNLGKQYSLERITELKRVLKAFGLYSGEIDGYYTSDLVDAVYDFQVAQGLMSTPYDAGAGFWGEATREKFFEIYGEPSYKVFRSNDIISKAEALKILMRMANVQVMNPETLGYSDITTDWHIPYVRSGQTLGLFNPSNDSSIFYPDSAVAREDMIHLIDRLIELYK